MLKNKVAVVTGGTRGIGYAVVKKFLDNGATVVLCGSRDETARQAVEQLKQENPDYRVEGISVDLLSPEDINEALRTSTPSTEAWIFWSTCRHFGDGQHLHIRSG